MDQTPDYNSLIAAIGGNITHGSPVILVAAIILLLVFLFKQYAMPKLQLGSGVLPWLSIGLGALIGVLSNVVGGMSPGQAANIMFISGPGASMFWSAVIKLFQKKE